MVAALLTALGIPALLHALPAAPAVAEVQAQASKPLRVYSNNIENLVTNLGKVTFSDDSSALKCEEVSISTHFNSMVMPADGQPDILMLQQVSGDTQADAYAKYLSNRYGVPYVALVVWDDDEMGAWGTDHGCTGPWADLGKKKEKQTNAIIYNSARLTRVKTSAYWSAGRLPNAKDDRNPSVSKCELYKDTGSEMWKRTSAFGVKFSVDGTSPKKYVFAATLHLPQENYYFPCAAQKDSGWLAGNQGSGIRFSSEATTLADQSDAVVIGIDANRVGLNYVSNSYGLQSAARADTHGDEKIDYLYVTGNYSDASTRVDTRSNHRAIFARLPY